MSLTTDDFIHAGSLGELPENCRSAHAANETWHELCCAQAKQCLKESAENSVDELDCMSVTIDGITYRVYGVIHGWSGGPNREYRQLVTDTIDKEEHLLFEKVLGNLYASGPKVQIPDFWVLGKLVQMILGFRLCLFFPWVLFVSLWEILSEAFSRNKGSDDLEQIFNSVNYHKLPPEIRRGVGYSLPTKLCIDHEIRQWTSARRFWDFETSLAVVARSAYMAEFAKEYAKAKGITEVALVVGDRHLTEVIYFLQHPLEMTHLSRAAARHGKIIAKSPAYYYLLFCVYLGFVSVGALGAISIYMTLYILYQQHYSVLP